MDYDKTHQVQAWQATGRMRDLPATKTIGMRNKPNHTCFPALSECAGCAFELGEMLAKRKPEQAARYVWMVVGSDNPCDIRRYAFTHEEGIAQLEHAKKNKYKDYRGGVWTLFKLVRVRKTKKKP